MADQSVVLGLAGQRSLVSWAEELAQLGLSAEQEQLLGGFALLLSGV